VQAAAVLAGSLFLGLIMSRGFGLYLFVLYCGMVSLVLVVLFLKQAVFFFVITYPLLSTFSFSLSANLPEFNYVRISMLLICFSFVLKVFYGKIRVKRFSAVEFWMLFYCLSSAISIFLTHGSSAFLSTMFYFSDNIVIPFLLFFISKNIYEGINDFRIFQKWLFIPAIYLTLMAVYEQATMMDILALPLVEEASQTVQGLRLETTGILRVNGPFPYPETFGIFTAMLFILLLFELIRRESSEEGVKGGIQRINILLLPLLAISLFLNKFRAIWLCTAIGLLFRYGMFSKYRLKLIYIIIFLIIVTWLLFPALDNTSMYQNRISKGSSVYERLATIKSSYAMFMDHPLYGVGNYNFTKIYKEYDYTAPFRGELSVPQAHNTYFCVLVENGILGFPFFMLILISLFLYMMRLFRISHDSAVKEHAAICLGILGAFTVASFFDNLALWGNVNILFYFAMGMLFSYTEDIVNKRKKSNKVLLDSL